MKNAADGEVFVVRKDVAATIWSMWQSGLWGPAAGILVPAEFHGDRTSGQPTPVSFLPNVTPGHLPSITASRDLYSSVMVNTVCGLLGCNPADVIADGLPSDVGGKLGNRWECTRPTEVHEFFLLRITSVDTLSTV